MKGVPQGRYTKEFREEVVKLVTEESISLPEAVHKRARQVCGPERLQRELAEQGVHVGICRIKRIKKKLGIRCKQKRKFKTRLTCS